MRGVCEQVHSDSGKCSNLLRKDSYMAISFHLRRGMLGAVALCLFVFPALVQAPVAQDAHLLVSGCRLLIAWAALRIVQHIVGNTATHSRPHAHLSPRSLRCVGFINKPIHYREHVAATEGQILDFHPQPAVILML